MKPGWVLVVASACAHNVPQDRATGPDGKTKGARVVALERGEGRARGIVTYPGGDRVDWKRIELPEGARGTLDLQLRYRTPRPGLQVAFDVFDQWNHPVGAKAPSRHTHRIRTASIGNARGAYLVRVYAPRRGDAGEYTLLASFKRDEVDIVDPTKLPVPDPPRLAAVPEVEPDCLSFDPRIKACEKVCPELGAPPGWKACAEQERKRLADEDRKRLEAERAERLKNAPRPIEASIKHLEIVGSAVRVTIAVGTASQPALDRTWSAAVVGRDHKPLIGASVRILGVDDRTVRAEIRGMTTDQLSANPRILLSPPPLSP